MIQTTSRLSRGARLRRGVPRWAYFTVVICVAAIALGMLAYRH